MYHVLRSILHVGRIAPTPAGSARIAHQRLHHVVQQRRYASPSTRQRQDHDLLRSLLDQECCHAQATHDA